MVMLEHHGQLGNIVSGNNGEMHTHYYIAQEKEPTMNLSINLREKGTCILENLPITC